MVACRAVAERRLESCLPSSSRAKAGEMRDVVFPELCGGVEISQTKCRSSAAASIFHQHNFKPKGFQHFHRSDSNVRFVISHECVVPENDRTTLLYRRSLNAVVAAIGERGRAAGV